MYLILLIFIEIRFLKIIHSPLMYYGDRSVKRAKL